VFESFESFALNAAPRMLRPYQLEAGDAIARSCCRRDGKIFVVMMSRQSGKNELAAVLHAFLLHLWAREGGDIIVAAPSFKPQIVNSERRLHEVLDMPLSHDVWQPHRGYYLELGNARLSFFSADRAANVVGATASILLSVDEAQDVDRDVYQRKFRPMASTTNATTVLFGTAWDEDNILEEQRRANREVEKRTGERLNFEVPWTVLAGMNTSYRQFVEGEIRRLGIDHPTIRTQYMLEAATGAGRLFSEELLERMKGTHGRFVGPEEGKQYVAGVDIAGQVSEDGKMVLNQWDETVVTIAEVDRSEIAAGGRKLPIVRVVQHYHWRGLTHAQQYERVRDLLMCHWKVTRVAIDATGIGAGPASFLVMGGGDRVDGVVFTQRSKSDLGFAMLAAAQTDRISLYQNQGGEDLRECLSQLQRIRYELRANEVMAWGAGGGGHDDYVASLALCVKAANETLPLPAGGIVRALPGPDDEGW
jgi:hypothetical protein